MRIAAEAAWSTPFPAEVSIGRGSALLLQGMDEGGLYDQIKTDPIGSDTSPRRRLASARQGKAGEIQSEVWTEVRQFLPCLEPDCDGYSSCLACLDDI